MTDIPGVDLSGDDYVIKQKLFRNKYRIYDGTGTLLLQTKQKLFKLKEEFPFLTADGDVAFTVKAKSMFDIAGDYALTDPDGELLAVLEKQFTFFKHVWRIRGPDGELYAKIESGSTFVEVLRNISGIFDLIPHSYTIEGPNGEPLGRLKGRLSLRDTYDLHLSEVGDAPKEALVAAAVAIDALEGN